jgi:hypothetical protein
VAKSLALANRNAIIYTKAQAGKSTRQIGEEHGLSHTQVANIIASYQGNLADDITRGVHAALLESLIAELMTDFKDSGPDPKVSATGKIIEVDGEVIMDNMTYLNVKATVAKTIQGLMESERKMLSADIPKKLPTPVSEARSEMDQYLAELEVKAKAAKDLDNQIQKARALGIIVDGETEPS